MIIEEQNYACLMMFEVKPIYMAIIKQENNGINLLFKYIIYRFVKFNDVWSYLIRHPRGSSHDTNIINRCKIWPEQTEILLRCSTRLQIFIKKWKNINVELPSGQQWRPNSLIILLHQTPIVRSCIWNGTFWLKSVPYRSSTTILYNHFHIAIDYFLHGSVDIDGTCSNAIFFFVYLLVTPGFGLKSANLPFLGCNRNMDMDYHE